MSRRTKLLITTLFLVLLGIPVAHVALTWRPANPLRIRIVPASRNTSLQVLENGGYLLPIEVENTSSTAVHLGGKWLASSASLPDRAVMDEVLIKIIWHHRGKVIPPHGKVTASVPVDRDHLRLAEQQGFLEVNYGWVSGVKFSAMDLCASRLLVPVLRHVPTPRIRPDYGSTLVEIPKGTAASFGLSLEPTPIFQSKGPLARQDP